MKGAYRKLGLRHNLRTNIYLGACFQSTHTGEGHSAPEFASGCVMGRDRTRPPPLPRPGAPSLGTTFQLCSVFTPCSSSQFWLTDDCWLQANFYLGLHDFDLADQRPYCFSVMVGHGKGHLFNVELGSELAVWEKSFQRATFMEVQRTGVSDSHFAQ